LLLLINDIGRQRYKEGTGIKTDLLDYLLLESNKLPKEERLSHAEVNSILMDILGAGHDTVLPLLPPSSLSSSPSSSSLSSFSPPSSFLSLLYLTPI